MGCSCVILAL